MRWASESARMMQALIMASPGAAEGIEGLRRAAKPPLPSRRLARHAAVRSTISKIDVVDLRHVGELHAGRRR